MRYNQNVEPVYTEGMAETVRMSIAATGKSFRTLIDSLYSRKIEAPIREWMSNALDSHIAAGTPELPFEVTLPSPLNPIFKVRDFGVGMSHWQVMNRYSVLYDSTKDGARIDDVEELDPDSQTGTLGLGSKSFFAYTDNAILTCYDGEEKRVYSIHMTQSQVPECSLMARMPSSKARGVAVQFAVKSNDYETFRDNYYRVLLGYTVLPNTYPISYAKNKSELFEEIVSGGASYPWTVIESEHLAPGIYGRQGSVLYRVELTNVFLDGVPGEYKSIFNSESLIFDFPIGTLNFTPSRESLEYTEQTIESVKDCLSEMRTERMKEISEAYDATNTDYERALLYMDQYSYLRRPNSTVTVNSFEQAFLLEKGVAKIYEELASRWACLLPDSKRRNDDRWTTPNLRYSLASGYRRSIAIRAREDRTYRVRNRYDTLPIRNSIIVVDDEHSPLSLGRRHYISRIRAYLNTCGFDTAYFVPYLSPRLHGILGRPPIHKLSDMPIPVGGNSSPSYLPPPYMKFIVHPPHNRTWEDSELPCPIGRIYIFQHAGLTYSGINSPERFDRDEMLALKRSINSRGRTLVLIKVRSNEHLSKFKHLPSIGSITDEIVNSLSDHEVKVIVNRFNKRTFQKSKFRHILNNCPRELLPLEIRRMTRFSSRVENEELARLRVYKKTSTSKRRVSSSMILSSKVSNFEDIIYPGTPEWQKLVDRALSLNLEVLVYNMPDAGVSRKAFRQLKTLDAFLGEGWRYHTSYVTEDTAKVLAAIKNLVGD